MVTAFSINKVILHSIKKSVRGEEIAPELSEASSELTPTIRSFLQQQIQGSLKHGRQIVEDRGLGSGVPDQIRDYWRGAVDLLECSQVLARDLQDTQPTQSPEGLLLVADAEVSSQRVFVVAKLEHERGAQATREPDKDGHLVISMTFLDDLVFTTGSQVYKIGYFPQEGGADGGLQGLVVDRQASGQSVARYFREDYLGCVWRERPEVVTEKFMNAVQDYIETVNDPEKRARYQVALIAELQKQEPGLSVTGFAYEHVDVSDRDAFVAKVKETLPSAEIPKDLTLVQHRLANVRIDTASGTVILASPQAMRDGTVSIESADEGDSRSTITVFDDITGTGSKGRFKIVGER